MNPETKPINIQMPKAKFGGMLVTPLKVGTKIKVRDDRITFDRGQRSTWVHGTLEYRDWLDNPDGIYPFYPGVRYSKYECDWLVILDDTEWELDK